MTFKFKKGKHRAWPPYWLFWFIWLIRPKQIRRRVLFYGHSKYELPEDDQPDKNKLFGISFTVDPKDTSARFGWYYDRQENVFKLHAFVHLKGQWESTHLCDCIANWPYDCRLTITKKEYIFRVDRLSDREIIAHMPIEKKHSRRSGYLLGPYFGGNQKAPKDLIIELKKV